MVDLSACCDEEMDFYRDCWGKTVKLLFLWSSVPVWFYPFQKFYDVLQNMFVWSVKCQSIGFMFNLHTCLCVG